MVLRQGLVCRKCGYDLNSSDATQCEVCSTSLKKGSIFSDTFQGKGKPLEIFGKWGVPFFLLLLGATAVHLFWKYAITQFTTSDTVLIEPTSQPNCTSLAPVEADKVAQIQLCPTMKAVNNVPIGQFSYSAPVDIAPLQAATNSITAAHPNFRLSRIDSPFAVKGSSAEMIISGEASFAVSMNPLSAEEQKIAASRGVTLQQIPIAATKLIFYTNSEVDVMSLSVEQLQAIYTEKITNWKQIGGADLPIVPVVQASEAEDTQTSFLLRGLPNSQQQFGKKVAKVKNFNDAIAFVKSTKGAISYAAQPLIAQQQINVVGITEKQSGKEELTNNLYLITKRLYVIIRQDNQLDQSAGLAYANLLLSSEGQKLIEKMGYLPIR